jgi:DNA-binding HxlR family transcriptional regulator
MADHGGPPTDDAPRYHDGALKDQPRRFNELRRLAPGITQRMLSVPPHVEYSFTRKGLTLGPILDAMEAWGEVNRPRRRRT